MTPPLDKIRSLIARALHASTPTEEARTSALIALRLIEEHRLLGGAAPTIPSSNDIANLRSVLASLSARMLTMQTELDNAQQQKRLNHERAITAEARARELMEDWQSERQWRQDLQRSQEELEARLAILERKSSYERDWPGNGYVAKPRSMRYADSYESNTPNDYRNEENHMNAAKASLRTRRDPKPQYPVREIEAQYGGVCNYCDGEYYKGDTIRWAKGRGAVHKKCKFPGE